MESKINAHINSAPLHTRREFCAQACYATAALAAGGWIAACGGSPTSPGSSAPQLGSVAAAVSGRTISVTVDAASALAVVGAAAIVPTALGDFLVARTAQDAFTALTAMCTHQACEVTGYSGGRFECPCHGSEFTTSGAVARGPAVTALRQFATQFSGGVLTFTV